jgi:hypothetical protein
MVLRHHPKDVVYVHFIRNKILLLVSFSLDATWCKYAHKCVHIYALARALVMLRYLFSQRSLRKKAKFLQKLKV